MHELPRYLWGGAARQGRSGRGGQFTRLAHHLLDLGDVLLFQLDLLAGVLLQPNALVAHEIEQLGARAQRRALVLEGLMQELPDLVLVRFDQLADLEGRGPPSDVTCSPAIEAWFMPSIAWLRISR